MHAVLSRRSRIIPSQEHLREELVERIRGWRWRPLLRKSRDMRLPGVMVRRVVKAGRVDDWSDTDE